MAKLPKGIDKMPSGKYKATASIGSGRTRKRKSKSFATITEAKQWMVEVNADMHSGTTYAGDDELITETYNEWVKVYVVGKVSPATELSYHFTGKIVAKYCGDMRIKDLSRKQCQELFNTIVASGYAKTTVQKFKVHLTKFCRNLVNEGVMKRNPMTDIDIRGAKHGKQADDKFMSITAYKCLLKELKQRPIHEMNVYGMVILTILCTGMRVSEAVDLRLDDIDREQATLRVDSSYSRVIHGSKAPKTANSYRTVPVPAFLINRLNQWRFRQNEVLMNKGISMQSDHLFLTETGSVPDASAMNFWVKKLQREVCGLAADETVTTHGLRHTYASYLLSREGGNQSITYVAAVLGDTQEMVQAVYAHLMPEEKASQADVVRDAIEAI
ncbi:site-specific integrase [Weissella viridescens]|uniref:tyrosine-type recombinase/integrase n=1 Tax=Weissella viridescens TaxID=1629 RepID=UPI001D09159B|nr:site-specific integrase [Weissella viridescens]MCB6840613.1 site-specific integrase [Weissella viridescens]MCB6847279.1 site-specific integrase [Weissella viridescens]